MFELSCYYHHFYELFSIDKIYTFCNSIHLSWKQCYKWKDLHRHRVDFINVISVQWYALNVFYVSDKNWNKSFWVRAERIIIIFYDKSFEFQSLFLSNCQPFPCSYSKKSKCLSLRAFPSKLISQLTQQHSFAQQYETQVLHKKKYSQRQ